MPSYYGIGVISTTSQVASTALSAQVQPAITYQRQRVGIVYQSCVVFTASGTQIAFMTNFTSNVIPGVAQLI